MSATVFGGGSYGTADETQVLNGFSIYTANASIAINSDQATGLNHIGSAEYAAIYNENAELTLEGVVSTADTTGGAIAAVKEAADIANSGLFANDTACTVFYVTGIGLTRTNTEFQTGTVTLMSWAGIVDTTGTALS